VVDGFYCKKRLNLTQSPLKWFPAVSRHTRHQNQHFKHNFIQKTLRFCNDNSELLSDTSALFDRSIKTRGSRAGAVSGQQSHCPVAGAEEGCGSSAVAAKVAGNAAPVTRPLGLSSAKPYRAAPSYKSSAAASAFDWSGAGTRAGAMLLAGSRLPVLGPRAFSLGLRGWGSSSTGRSTGPAGWGEDGRDTGLSIPARAPSISSTTVHSRSRGWSMVLASLDFGGTCG
jgi:hypothetical protein